jgi:hypothetical protein
MAIAWRSGNSGGNGSGGNVTVTKPTGTVDGDILLAVTYREAGAWTLPTGWAWINAGTPEQANNTGNGWVGLAWKRASSEGASYTFQLSATTWRTVTVGAWSGCVTSGNPWDVYTSHTGVNTDIVVNALTTTVANTMLVVGTANYNGDNPTAGASGMTARTMDGGCGFFDEPQAATGSTGTQALARAAGTGGDWAVWHLALKPAGGAPAAQTINANAIAGGAPWQPTVTAGGLTIQPAAIAGGVPNQPALAFGAISVAPQGIAGGAPYLPAVTQGALTVTPTVIVGGAPWQPAVTGGSVNWHIPVGAGYSDVSPKQVVRTSGNVMYAVVPNCDIYPDFSANGLTQTIRVYKGDSTGVATGFTRKDSGNEPAAVVGCAAALDGNDNIHIVWQARSSASLTRYLRYAVFDTATDTWGSVTTIAGNSDFDDIGQGHQNVALVLDSANAAHIVYLSTNGTGVVANTRVWYRNNSGGSWSGATQIDSGVTYTGNQKAWNPALALDDAGRILVVWERGEFNGNGNGDLYSRVFSGGSWGSTVQIDSGESLEVGIDQGPSLLVTPDGTWHVAYLLNSATHSQKYIRYAYSTNQGATWTANNPSNQATHNPSLGYARGKVRIYGHGTPDTNNHGQNLYYLEGSGGAAAWGNWTLFYTGASYDSSINVRWAQFHHYYPSTIDLIYWDDNYPNMLFAGTQVQAADIVALPIAGGAPNQPAVNVGALTIAPQAISGGSPRQPALSMGAVTVAVTAIAGGAPHQPGVTFGAISINVTAIVGGAPYQPTVTQGATVVANPVPGGAPYQPSFTFGAISVQVGVVAGGAPYLPAVQPGAIAIAPQGIAGGAPYLPAVTQGAPSVYPAAIAGGAPNLPTLLFGAVAVEVQPIAGGAPYLPLILVLTAVVSAARTQRVAVEVRTVSVAAESRTWNVAAESRTREA